MHHDFAPRNGGNGHQGSGGGCEANAHMMSYGKLWQMKRWSTCSRNNFRAHYDEITSFTSWCMDSKILKITIPINPL